MSRKLRDITIAKCEEAYLISIQERISESKACERIGLHQSNLSAFKKTETGKTFIEDAKERERKKRWETVNVQYEQV